MRDGEGTCMMRVLILILQGMPWPAWRPSSSSPAAWATLPEQQIILLKRLCKQPWGIDVFSKKSLSLLIMQLSMLLHSRNVVGLGA